MREEITYVANDGLRFASKEDCLVHDRKLEEYDVVNKEKKAALEAIKEKYNSLNDDIIKYKTKYKEPVILDRLPGVPSLINSLFNLL